MMSSISKRTVIRHVLEETGFAYVLSCEMGSNHSDYADFVSSQALPSFQDALRDPNLTYDKLCALLRNASRTEASRKCKTPWSVFMANYIEKQCNNNQKLN